MLYVRPGGSLCNRLRTIESAIKLMQEYEDRAVILWDVDRWVGCRLDELFEISDNLPIEICVNNSELNAEAMNGAECYNLYEEKQLVEAYKEGHKKRYLESGYSFYGKQEYAWLRPKGAIEKKIECLTKKMGKNCIGVHIRRTDNNPSILYSPIELFIKKIDELLKETPDLMIYLATDGEQTKKLLLDKYGERIVVNETAELTRETKDGMEDAVIDLYCLAACNKIFGSFWSSYSETAGYIGQKPVEYLTVDESTVLEESKLDLEFMDRCQKAKYVVIVGMGYCGQLLYVALKRELKNVTIICCDNAESMQKKMRFWKEETEVLSVEEVTKKYPDSYYLLAFRGGQNMETVEAQLTSYGVPVECIEKKAGVLFLKKFYELKK